MVKTNILIVKGRVQGIGFRPFIYNIAKKYQLTGYVKNTQQGVKIEIQGKNSEKLIKTLQNNPPRLSKISELSIYTTRKKLFHKFQIVKSEQTFKNPETVEIIPDLAICGNCVSEIQNTKNRRYFYPFTNCTQCGPRYSIIKKLPYDRPRTTMDSFIMCPNCLNEYQNPTNRRFHAQPNACQVCGPELSLIDIKRNIIIKGTSNTIIIKCQRLISNGKIVAIRSIGGFQIVCDAKNNAVIRKLRLRKNRPYKPLAVMCKDINNIKSICRITKSEEKLLKSQIAPIVLLKKRENSLISVLIAPKNGYFGVMLPYTPLHKLLFQPARYRDSIVDNNVENVVSNGVNVSRETSPDILVMTSANLKGAPIIADSASVVKYLNNIVDFVLDHNRPIYSRCDDSVVFDYKGPVIVRYSRGYVPEPIFLKNMCVKPVLAFGADLKNGFALGKDNKVYLSPYIGDLICEESVNFLFEILDKYLKWFNISPEIIGCDLHPDYISVRLAEQFANKHRLRLVKVQHHFAHLVGVMAENSIIKPVLGLGFDGTGYGTDRQVWGGEIMKLNLSGFTRLAHLKYMPLVSGDVATTNPRLIAKTYLEEIQKSKVKNQKFNMMMTSSLARLFDAVASILGICHIQTFEGEAPTALEQEAIKALHLKRDVVGIKQKAYFDPRVILQEVIDMKRRHLSIPEIALYFHKVIVSDVIALIKQLGAEYNIKTVCGSGGIFQNQIILQGIDRGLTESGYRFFVNRRVPVNDGGIAFGQAIVAGQK